MFESRTASSGVAKKKIRYEPIERRRADRRGEADRRTEPRSENSSDRRQDNDRRK